MKYLSLSALLLIFFSSCSNSQVSTAAQRKLLGTCEGCEAVFEFGNRELNNTDTLPDFNGEGKRIKITGTIYKPDGKTPAKDVILYVYHTNQQGLYAPLPGDTGLARRNGHIRGWMKTGSDGSYNLYTLLPGIYPQRNAPAHIHPIILEPNGNYYWLNSFLFKGDTLITARDLDPRELRGGGDGIVDLKLENGMWTGKRDIVLGRNVPGYQ